MKCVSIIIPVLPGEFPHQVVECLQWSNHPHDEIEVIIAEGLQPSRQRNEAAKIASGDFLYFLDDDSFVTPTSISTALEFLAKTNSAAVGGPAVTHRKASFLEDCFGEVVGAPCGTFITRARNVPVGSAREVRGEELILCNLMVRKNAFNQVSGLDERLYPNEENEMLKRMRAKGFSFYYVPEMFVRRSRRKDIFSFARQMFNYGWGRGRHIFVRFHPRDFIFLLPVFFLAYLLLLFFYRPSWLLAPLALYLLLTGLNSLEISIRRKAPMMMTVAFLLFPLVHLTYGAGLLWGLIGKWNKVTSPNAHIRLSRFNLASDNEKIAAYGS